MARSPRQVCIWYIAIGQTGVLTMFFVRMLRVCAIIVAPALLVAGCGTTVVTTDPVAIQAAVALKTDTLALLDKSGSRYAANRAAADALMQRYAAAAEKAGQNPSNAAVATQWAGIRNPRGVSAANAIELWKRAPLRPNVRADKKRIVAAHFDHLICLEEKSAAECAGVGLEATASAPRRPAAAPAATPAPAEADEPPPDGDSEPGEAQQ